MNLLVHGTFGWAVVIAPGAKGSLGFAMSFKLSPDFTYVQFLDEHCDPHGYPEQLAYGDILVFLVIVIM